MSLPFLPGTTLTPGGTRKPKANYFEFKNGLLHLMHLR